MSDRLMIDVKLSADTIDAFVEMGIFKRNHRHDPLAMEKRLGLFFDVITTLPLDESRLAFGKYKGPYALDEQERFKEIVAKVVGLMDSRA